MNATGIAEFLALIAAHFPSDSKALRHCFGLEDGKLKLFVYAKSLWHSFTIDDEDMALSPQALAGDIIALLEAPTDA